MGHLEKQVGWLSYAAVVLALASEYQLGPLVADGRWAELFADGRPALWGGWLVSVLAVLLLCARKTSRPRAIGMTAVAAAVVLGPLSLLEMALPPFHRATEFQQALQGQLERRESMSSHVFRGVECTLNGNRLGWIGDEWPIEPDAGRIVFIGDSFLESASSQTLASRVEQRLRAGGWDGDVVNLSKFSTSPDPEYRHRFQELAFEYRPDHIVMFLYSGNDLHRSYRYGPYRHPSFRMSRRALEFCRAAGLEARALGLLERSMRLGTSWDDKAGFFDAMPADGLDFQDRHLAYLAGLAYSVSEERTWTGRWWGGALSRIGLLGEKLKRWKKRLQGKKPPLTADVLAEYEAVFELPRDRRLDALVMLMARHYGSNADRLLEIVRTFPASLIDYVLKEPDSPALLFRAMWYRIHDKADKHSANPSEIARVRTEHAKLLNELAGIAKARGVGFSVVMIPVAGIADREFREFWSPLIDTAAGSAYRDVARTALAEELEGMVPVIDLGDDADRFAGGYWKMDGHWNETGHAAAAEIVVDHLRSLEVGL